MALINPADVTERAKDLLEQEIRLTTELCEALQSIRDHALSSDVGMLEQAIADAQALTSTLSSCRTERESLGADSKDEVLSRLLADLRAKSRPVAEISRNTNSLLRRSLMQTRDLLVAERDGCSPKTTYPTAKRSRSGILLDHTI